MSRRRKPVDDLDCLDDTVTGCAGAHQRLLRWLDDLEEKGGVDVNQPSELPGWSVGHVLTHFARNADACRNMLEGAAAGEQRPMYPGGMDQRSADIESGAPRPFGEHVRDIRMSIWKLEGVWAGLDAEAWRGQGLFVTGPIAISLVPRRRWREVEVHHSDLGLGFTWRDWSDEFVRVDLPRRRIERNLDVPDEVRADGDRAELAWLFSRDLGEGFPPSPPWG